jgi:hypothetical protein
MPHWVALLAIVVSAWMILAVVGGWLIGRGLRVIKRDADVDDAGDPGDGSPLDLRRAA